MIDKHGIRKFSPRRFYTLDQWTGFVRAEADDFAGGDRRFPDASKAFIEDVGSGHFWIDDWQVCRAHASPHALKYRLHSAGSTDTTENHIEFDESLVVRSGEWEVGFKSVLVGVSHEFCSSDIKIFSWSSDSKFVGCVDGRYSYETPEKRRLTKNEVEFYADVLRAFSDTDSLCAKGADRYGLGMDGKVRIGIMPHSRCWENYADIGNGKFALVKGCKLVSEPYDRIVLDDEGNFDAREYSICDGYIKSRFNRDGQPIGDKEVVREEGQRYRNSFSGKGG